MIEINSFIKYIQYEKRYSEHTVTAYKKDISDFLCFCENENITELVQINKHTVRAWIIEQKSLNKTNNTVNRKLSALKSFFKFLMKNEIITTNPTSKIISPKKEKQLAFFLSEKEMSQILDDIEYTDTFEGLRDKTIIEILYSTGIRLSELINIKINDIDKANLQIKINGKRKKQRIIPVTHQLLNTIENYNNTKSKEQNNNNYLITTIKAEKAYPKLIYRTVNKLIKQVSTVQKKSPHVIRHSFGTHMLNHGANINTIKELLGHENLNATQIYTHNTFNKLKNIYKLAHPRA